MASKGIPLKDFKGEVIGAYVPLKFKDRYIKESKEFEDEVCPKCSCYFAPYHHMIKCRHAFEGTCPMSDGKTVLEIMKEGLGNST